MAFFKLSFDTIDKSSLLLNLGNFLESAGGTLGAADFLWLGRVLAPSIDFSEESRLDWADDFE